MLLNLTWASKLHHVWVHLLKAKIWRTSCHCSTKTKWGEIDIFWSSQNFWTPNNQLSTPSSQPSFLIDAPDVYSTKYLQPWGWNYALLKKQLSLTVSKTADCWIGTNWTNPLLSSLNTVMASFHLLIESRKLLQVNLLKEANPLPDNSFTNCTLPKHAENPTI